MFYYNTEVTIYSSYSDCDIVSRKHHQKSYKWYVSLVFLQTLDWMVANSRVLFATYSDKKFPNKFMKRDLSFQLRSLGLSLWPSTLTSLVGGGANSLLLNFEPHLPPPTVPEEIICQYRLDRSKPHYAKKFHKSRYCKGHRQFKKTRYYCSFCGIFLCDEGCFVRFHKLTDYLFSDDTLSHVHSNITTC